MTDEQIALTVRNALMDGDKTVEFDSEVAAAKADFARIFHGEKPVNFPAFDYMGVFKRLGLKGIPDYRVN